MDSAADESVIESLLLEKDSINSKIEELDKNKSELEPLIESAKLNLENARNAIGEHIKTKPSNEIVQDFENSKRELGIKERNLERIKSQIEALKTRFDSITGRINSLTQDNIDAKEVVDVETIELGNYVLEHEELENKLNHVRCELEDNEKAKQEAQLQVQ